jgi:hypothetical protein
MPCLQRHRERPRFARKPEAFCGSLVHCAPSSIGQCGYPYQKRSSLYFGPLLEASPATSNMASNSGAVLPDGAMERYENLWAKACLSGTVTTSTREFRHRRPWPACGQRLGVWPVLGRRISKSTSSLLRQTPSKVPRPTYSSLQTLARRKDCEGRISSNSWSIKQPNAAPPGIEPFSGRI